MGLVAHRLDPECGTHAGPGRGTQTLTSTDEAEPAALAQKVKGQQPNPAVCPISSLGPRRQSGESVG